ncbi:terminase small subunit [Culicoidibacter larvae]|uniref:terminase small subunit n=1 Tax=Culicoidibacter larvae TaxID=2579976 RepID=UPI00148524F4|nr:terminase small subunit [Culicoidibacter larvae]
MCRVAKIKEQHKKLADRWLAGDCSQEEAALFAGYAPKNARKQGYLVLDRPEVQEYIQEQLEKMQSERIADAVEIREYLTRVMRGEELEEQVTKLQDKTFQKGGGMIITERTEIIEVKPRMSDRNKAAELLGKGYALYTDRVEQDVKGTVVIVNDLPDD